MTAAWEVFLVQRSYLPAVIVMIAMVLTAYVASGSNRSQVDRGRYIVTRVAMCTGCHTPWRLSGPSHAPDLTSTGLLRDWEDGQATVFLMTGVTPAGIRTRPPMPRYRFDEDDAAAVTAYLRTLPPAKQPNRRGP